MARSRSANARRRPGPFDTLGVLLDLKTIIDAIVDRARTNAATDDELDYGSNPYQAIADVRQTLECDPRQFGLHNWVTW